MQPKQVDPVDSWPDDPTEYEVTVAMLRHAVSFSIPSIVVAGCGVYNDTLYLAPGNAGIWLTDRFQNLCGTTNLATLMRTGFDC